jgi:hypothetical protein
MAAASSTSPAEPPVTPRPPFGLQFDRPTSEEVPLPFYVPSDGNSFERRCSTCGTYLEAFGLSPNTRSTEWLGSLSANPQGGHVSCYEISHHATTLQRIRRLQGPWGGKVGHVASKLLDTSAQAGQQSLSIDNSIIAI